MPAYVFARGRRSRGGSLRCRSRGSKSVKDMGGSRLDAHALFALPLKFGVDAEFGKGSMSRDQNLFRTLSSKRSFVTGGRPRWAARSDRY